MGPINPLTQLEFTFLKGRKLLTHKSVHLNSIGISLRWSTPRAEVIFGGPFQWPYQFNPRFASYNQTMGKTLVWLKRVHPKIWCLQTWCVPFRGNVMTSPICRQQPRPVPDLHCMSNPNMPCIHHPCPVLLFGLFNLGGVLYTPSQNISYPRQFGGKKKLKTSMTEWLSKCVRSYFRHTFPIFSHGSLLPGLQAVPSASGFGAFSFLALPLASVQMSILVPRRSIPLTLATRELSRLPVYVLQRKWETVGYKCYCPSCPTYPSVAQMWQLISLFLCCSRWM